MNKIKKIFKRGGGSGGFTLVELLIVIGLLGAIALIVIAAINPIEQANRARDTRFKADSAQLISAIDRYFAARSEFPWVTLVPATNNEDPYGFVSAGDEGVGICGATCVDPGFLIANDELKTEFKNRDFIEEHLGTDNSKKIFIGKATGTSSSIYACYIPMSKSSRQNAAASDDVYTLEASGARVVVVGADPTAQWVALDYYVCVPE